jgi:two-component system, NarL family, nitrate/nitrite response regulator NarL
MSDNLRIVVVDDHPMFREGVINTLNGDPGLDVVGQGADAATAVRLTSDLLPDIVLLDISMPGSGIEAARQIGISCPVVKIIMVTVSEQDDDVIAALQAGASGYILKGVGGSELVAIIRTVQNGESYVSPDLAARLLANMRHTGNVDHPAHDPLSDLTLREEQVLKFVSRGLSNKEIGNKLGLREKTVKHYMTNILQKLQVRNRVEAALVARDKFTAD